MSHIELTLSMSSNTFTITKATSQPLPEKYKSRLFHILWEKIPSYYGNLFPQNEGIFSQAVGNLFP